MPLVRSPQREKPPGSGAAFRLLRSAGCQSTVKSCSLTGVVMPVVFVALAAASRAAGASELLSCSAPISNHTSASAGDTNCSSASASLVRPWSARLADNSRRARLSSGASASAVRKLASARSGRPLRRCTMPDTRKASGWFGCSASANIAAASAATKSPRSARRAASRAWASARVGPGVLVLRSDKGRIATSCIGPIV